MNIQLSLHSQKLIKKYLLESHVHSHELSSITTSADLAALISWLNKEQKYPRKSKKQQQKIEFILVSLRTALLHDLFLSMKGDDIKLPKEEEHNTPIDKIKFTLLTIAGILVAACQGFDGIVTMLSIFNLSSSMILAAGFAFSFLSVIVFCGFDLVKVSKALGVKLSDAYKLLDAYLLQLQMIKSIRKKINEYNLSDLSQDNLKQLECIISMLQKRFSLLTEASQQFGMALESENMKMAKTLISGVSGILFFGGGFFAGQSVALFMSGLLVNPLTPAFWPVILFSVIVGFAAFSIYWYVERPGLDKLVSSWFGLNEENIQKLCDKSMIKKEIHKLESLKRKIISAARLAKRVTQAEQAVDAHDELLIDGSVHERTVIDIRTSGSYYSFLKPQEPADLLPKISLEQEPIDQSCCFM
ncbi:hypothetical protein DGG96_05820 [Legionella qingyii]|uniref:Coiled-coil protein n=1 Tax=Legionella qingyii TaxID=2184757 RepID=A0A317U5E4_9GAMM|nr:hypothetical protein [Legionella qingyii]PWY56639.1 hypothetical protein DGG96_05820 [Legionella qingyii]RUR23452.1 hypothetical protein ELY20_07545 [Legionella qingyii]RUR26101.1 hypothetical protein ELY16_08130 [Legionella qingyii]